MLQQFNEKNRDLVVNINGKLLHRDEAGVSPFDSIVQGGDGVWEGLRLYDGKIFKLTEHLDRLRTVLDGSGAIAEALYRFLEQPALHRIVVGDENASACGDHASAAPFGSRPVSIRVTLALER